MVLMIHDYGYEMISIDKYNCKYYSLFDEKLEVKMSSCLLCLQI